MSNQRRLWKVGLNDMIAAGGTRTRGRDEGGNHIDKVILHKIGRDGKLEP